MLAITDKGTREVHAHGNTLYTVDAIPALLAERDRLRALLAEICDEHAHYIPTDLYLRIIAEFPGTAEYEARAALAEKG